MRSWRKMTWALIAWCALIVVWIATGIGGADCENEEFQEACEAGTGIGVTLVFILGFMGFLVLSIIWFMTRPKSPLVSQPAVAQPFVARDVGVNRAAERRPPTPQGWYQDPQRRFDLRYWDGARWTDHVANHGDDDDYLDPMKRE